MQNKLRKKATSGFISQSTVRRWYIKYVPEKYTGSRSCSKDNVLLQEAAAARPCAPSRVRPSSAAGRQEALNAK